MKDFALLFRQANYNYSKNSPEEMEEIDKRWQNWIGGIAAQGKLATGGSRLAAEGTVLKAGGLVTDGPFVEIREILGGFIVVKADNLEEATTLAHGCPALDSNGSVEIRPLFV
ncbi:YciI family protein [Pedobacter sp.]|jgi:hypothetical protein|uniref:YciI family protein n=1 Tax=Pedobacter sp. TaxID=1411316 RepID=UPI002C6AEF2D|nr:YciI family protein [Pedobacter sp.]HWW38048.1 YciI family protein [Pedobacter sp.]